MFDQEQDAVQLAHTCERWPVELAQKLLADSASWGTSDASFLGSSKSQGSSPTDQSADFFKLASCVDGLYERHQDLEQAWNWANHLIQQVQAGASWKEYQTQDLLDIVFLYCRGERFCDGLIYAEEPLLRAIVQEVVSRVSSQHPPIFLKKSQHDY